MNPELLVGLRPEDLVPDEHHALADLLLEPRHADDHAFAKTLDAMSSECTTRRPATEVLALARRVKTKQPRRSNTWALAGASLLAIAAAGLMMTLPASPTSRTRGGTPARPVQLEAVVDGSMRPLSVQGEVDQEEQVVFQVHTPGPGRIELREDTHTLVHSWTTLGGVELLGGSSPLAWRPDPTHRGTRVYAVQWCPDGGGACSSDELSLFWR